MSFERCVISKGVKTEETICPDGSLKPKVSALLSRIAELERDKKALRGIEENLREHIDIGTLQLSVATARIAELKAYIDQLIEVGEKMFTAVIAAADPYDEGMREWDKLVRDRKEG